MSAPHKKKGRFIDTAMSLSEGQSKSTSPRRPRAPDKSTSTRVVADRFSGTKRSSNAPNEAVSPKKKKKDVESLLMRRRTNDSSVTMLRRTSSLPTPQYSSVTPNTADELRDNFLRDTQSPYVAPSTNKAKGGRTTSQPAAQSHSAMSTSTGRSGRYEPLPSSSVPSSTHGRVLSTKTRGHASSGGGRAKKLTASMVSERMKRGATASIARREANVVSELEFIAENAELAQTVRPERSAHPDPMASAPIAEVPLFMRRGDTTMFEPMPFAGRRYRPSFEKMYREDFNLPPITEQLVSVRRRLAAMGDPRALPRCREPSDGEDVAKVAAWRQQFRRATPSGHSFFESVLSSEERERRQKRARTVPSIVASLPDTKVTDATINELDTEVPILSGATARFAFPIKEIQAELLIMNNVLVHGTGDVAESVLECVFETVRRLAFVFNASTQRIEALADREKALSVGTDASRLAATPMATSTSTKSGGGGGGEQAGTTTRRSATSTSTTSSAGPRSAQDELLGECAHSPDSLASYGVLWINGAAPDISMGGIVDKLFESVPTLERERRGRDSIEEVTRLLAHLDHTDVDQLPYVLTLVLVTNIDAAGLRALPRVFELLSMIAAHPRFVMLATASNCMAFAMWSPVEQERFEWKLYEVNNYRRAAPASLFDATRNYRGVRSTTDIAEVAATILRTMCSHKLLNGFKIVLGYFEDNQGCDGITIDDLLALFKRAYIAKNFEEMDRVLREMLDSDVIVRTRVGSSKGMCLHRSFTLAKIQTLLKLIDELM